MKTKKKHIPSVFQFRLPFDDGVLPRTVTTTLSLETRLLYSIGFYILFVSVWYVYFVMASISFVVVKEDTLRNIEHTKNSVFSLEQQYLESTAVLSEERARSLGLSKTQPVFVTRTSFSFAEGGSE